MYTIIMKPLYVKLDNPNAHYRSSVRVVCSIQSGMGKSLYITRMAEKLNQKGEKSNHVIIPIHGPKVTSDLVLRSLQEYYGRAEGNIYRFDIAPNVFNFFLSI